MKPLYPWHAPIIAQLERETHRAKAWLLEGPQGLGQLEFAQAFLSEHCHPADILVVEPESSTISVNQIREITEYTQQSAYQSPFKGIIVNTLDKLHRNAQHAFLKTLEEPNTPTAFMLINENPRAVLATTRSRCQRLRFSPVPYSSALPWLKQQGIDVCEADYIALGEAPLAVTDEAIAALHLINTCVEARFKGNLQADQIQAVLKCEPSRLIALLQQSSYRYVAQHPQDKRAFEWYDQLLSLAQKFALNPNINMSLQLQALLEG